MSARLSMRCPSCGGPTEAKRASLASNGTIRRERTCQRCPNLLVTSERIVKQREREMRPRVYPLGDQLDADFGVLGSSLTRAPVRRGRNAVWKNGRERKVSGG